MIRVSRSMRSATTAQLSRCRSQSRGKAPVWLNEGLAQVAEETDDPGRTGRLRLALQNEGLAPLTELEAGFTKLNREQASLAYSEAHAAAVTGDRGRGIRTARVPAGSAPPGPGGAHREGAASGSPHPARVPVRR